MPRASWTGASLALAGAVGVATPAVAQNQSECLEELAEYDATRTGMNEHLSDHELRGFAVMRSAVRFLAQSGREEACEELAETYGEMLADRREELVDEGLVVEVQEQERVAQLESAPKVSELQQSLRAGDVIGSDLRNTMNQDLGDVQDVVFDPEGGNISHILVETGGFLGLGQDVLAVPLEALRVTDNVNTFVLDMSRERFSEAPKLEAGATEQVREEAWRQQNDSYYLAGN